MKNKKETWGIILLVGSYIIDTITFFICGWLDTVVLPDPDALGHPAPITLLLWFVLMVPFTIITNIIGIVLLVTSNNNRPNNMVNKTISMQTMEPMVQAQEQQTVSKVEKQTRCPNCGQPVNSDDIYCNNCGYKLN